MNELFKKMYDGVVVSTNRPHLIEETIKEIQNATLYIHGRAQFVKDVKASIIQSTGQGQTKFRFDLPNSARIRQVINVYPVSSSGKLGNKLAEKKFGSEIPFRCGGYYSVFGDTITINVSSPVSQFQINYLQFPNVSPSNYDSWIARTYPYLIQDLATSFLLSTIGINDKAKVFRSRVGEVSLPGSYIWQLIADNSTVDNV